MNCPICLESIRDPYITDCFHKFCTECFEDWKIEKIANYTDITCPVCRTILEKNEKNENNEVENEIVMNEDEDQDDEDSDYAEDEITSQNTKYETDSEYEPNSEYEYEDY